MNKIMIKRMIKRMKEKKYKTEFIVLLVGLLLISVGAIMKIVKVESTFLLASGLIIELSSIVFAIVKYLKK